MKVKKIIALLLVVVTVVCSYSVPASAANSATCASYGFQVDTSAYKNIGFTANYLKQNVYYGRPLIGTSNTILLVATQKAKVGSKNMNVAMYYTIMSPKAFSAPSASGTRSYKGKSELLTITTTLPKSSQSLRVTYPENVAGATSYTLGGSFGASDKGITAGVSATTTITKNRLRVTNKSDVDKRKYQVEYDYKTALLGTNSSNSYLKNISTQRGSIYYLTDGKPFNIPVKVKASFGGYWGIYCYNNLAQKTTTWYVSIA